MTQNVKQFAMWTDNAERGEAADRLKAYGKKHYTKRNDAPHFFIITFSTAYLYKYLTQFKVAV